MSDLASPYQSPAGRSSMLAFALAIAAVVAYVVAGLVDDAIYTLAGILGMAAFGVGVKSRRAAKRAGGRTWAATAAAVIGGLLGGAVLAALVGWAVYHLAT